MDINDLKPIIDLMNLQEERLVKKMDTHAHDTHERLDKINGKVAEHEKYINNNRAIFKFIIGGIGIVATVVGIWFAIFHK